MTNALDVSVDQIKSFFDNPRNPETPNEPVVLSTAKAAELIGAPKATIYRWLSKGYLKRCARRRGTRVYILRDLFLWELFSSPEEWSEE